MISAPPDRCPTCSGAIIDDDGPVCMLCGRTPVGAMRFRLPKVEEEEEEGSLETETVTMNGNLVGHEADKLANAILAGHNVTEAAAIAGVRKDPAYLWLNKYASEELRAKLKETARQRMQEAAERRLKTGGPPKPRKAKATPAEPAPEPISISLEGKLHKHIPKLDARDTVSLDVEAVGPEAEAKPFNAFGFVLSMLEDRSGTLANFDPVGRLSLEDLNLLTLDEFDAFWGALGLLVRAKVLEGK